MDIFFFWGGRSPRNDDLQLLIIPEMGIVLRRESVLDIVTVLEMVTILAIETLPGMVSILWMVTVPATVSSYEF